jgi:hypothetical protein
LAGCSGSSSPGTGDPPVPVVVLKRGVDPLAGRRGQRLRVRGYVVAVDPMPESPTFLVYLGDRPSDSRDDSLVVCWFPASAHADFAGLQRLRVTVEGVAAASGSALAQCRLADPAPPRR